jgi:hypothetical protein
MANFSGGGSFSTGFTRGGAIKNARATRKAAEQDAVRERLQESITAAKETSQDNFDKLLEVGSKVVAQGGETRGVRQAAIASTLDYANTLRQLEMQVENAGGDPAELGIPSSQGFIRERMAILDLTLGGAEGDQPGAVGKREGEKAVAEAQAVLGTDKLTDLQKREAAGFAPTAGIKEFDFAKNEGFTGSFLDFKKAIAEAGSTRVVMPTKPPSGFRFKEDGLSLEPIPGGPQDTLTPEGAAKLQLLETAIRSSNDFKKFIISEKEVTDDDGNVTRVPDINRTNIANMNIGTPFTQGRSANVLLLDSIEAKLRAESGAAVPETEVKRAGKRFRPTLLDSDETIIIKLDLLNRFLEGAFNKAQRDGRFDVVGTVDALDEQANRELAAVGAGPDSEEDEERLKGLGL